MQSKILSILLIAVLLIMSVPALANDEIAAPENACPNNLTLLPAGMEMSFSPNIQAGTVINSFVEQNILTMLHNTFMSYFQDNMPVDTLLTAELDPINSGANVFLGGNYFCISEGFLLAVIREADMEGIHGYVIEKIIITDLALTEDIIAQFTIEALEQLELAPEENAPLDVLTPLAPLTLNFQAAQSSQGLNLQAQNLTPHLINARFNFWRLYIEPPVVSVGTAGSLLNPTTPPQNYCGDYTALSNLSVGMQAEMDGYYFAQFPNSGDLTDDVQNSWLDLGDALQNDEISFNFYLDAQLTPIYSAAPTDLESNALEADAATIWEAPYYGTHTVEILAGPACREYQVRDDNDCSGQDICENDDEFDANDLYSVWWQIEVTIHGESYIGWYPENLRQYSWWLWETEGKFDRVSTAYLLMPIAMQTMAGNACETLPSSRFVAGMEVQANSTMNLRNAANGDVIGRIESGNPMTLIGNPLCEGGIRWWQANLHSGAVGQAWIAENDASSFFITPYQAPIVVTEEIRETSAPIVIVTPQPEATRNPSSSRPSSCDPTTGRGC